jgi:glycosyltransferase involved in cell wall biosynthesis
MFRGRMVAVVVPAFNEADKIGETLRTMPAFVDWTIVVDDGSSDGTARAARTAGGGRGRTQLDLIVHPENRGVGAALATGYARALELGADAVVVMAGDGQMDPADLPRLLTPIADGSADYAKGNRLAWPGGWRQIPPVRLVGSLALSWVTQLATGYRGIFDSQCGYTAVSRAALLAIGPEHLYPRYGYPNDLLARLAAVGARVVDVPVRPVYGPAWRSGLRPSRVAAPLTGILLRAFAGRLRRRGRAPEHLEGPR